MLNPILHSATQADAERFRVEPYVIAADVYSVAPYVGMGGWTWYTGSSGWMYRLGIEAILGIVREGDNLRINPSIPRAWTSYRIRYQFGATIYHIQVENPDGVCHGVYQVVVDGEEQPDLYIPLSNTKPEYHVTVLLGQKRA
jgi:cyclic beta-1,2-glucan synthetase